MRLLWQFLVLAVFTTTIFAGLEAPKEITLQLKWNHQFQFAGYYAAKEKGYYKNIGLNVNFRQLKETKDPYGDVLNGKAEFGVYTSELIAKYNRGDRIVALAAIFQHSPLAIMTLKDSGLDSIIKLQDKKISLEYGSAELEAYLSREGVKLKPQNTITNGDVGLLAQKKVDAISVYISDEPYFFDKQKIAYNLFYPQKAGIDFYGDILFTTKEFAKNNQKLVENFKRATLMGWEYAIAHPEEITDLILNKYNSADKTREQLLFEATQMKKIIKSDTVEIGYLYQWRIEQILKIYEELGVSAKSSKQDINEFIFEGYVKSLGAQRFSLNSDEKKYLSDKKTLRVCADPDWLPMEKINRNGEHIGIAADVLKKLSEKLGVAITLTPTKDWGETLEFIKDKKCDIISMAMETKERQSYLLFTKPYFSSPLSIVTKDDKPFINILGDALDKRFAVVKGYAIVDTLKKKYPNINFVETQNRTEGLQKVMDGSAYGYIDALACNSYSIGKDGWSDMKISAKLEDEFKLSIAVRSEDQILMGILDKALSSISKEEKEEIFNRWFNVTIKEGVSYESALKWFSVLLVIIAALYYKNVILKRRVEREIKIRTEQETVLMERTKAAQMGELLDIIAHQWKQPLSAIHLVAEDIVASFKYDELTEESLIRAKNTIIERVAFLTKTLDETRGFLNPNQPSKLFDASQATVDLLAILSGMLRQANINAIVDLDEEIALYGSKNSYQNIILSIIINAKEIFKIRKIESPTLYVSLKKTDKKAILTIDDNGGGIEDGVVNRVFDYRFTTMSEIGGTGVGLYFVKLIVTEKFNGTIIASNVKNGARFVSTFNLCDSPA